MGTPEEGTFQILNLNCLGHWAKPEAFLEKYEYSRNDSCEGKEIRSRQIDSSGNQINTVNGGKVILLVGATGAGKAPFSFRLCQNIEWVGIT